MIWTIAYISLAIVWIVPLAIKDIRFRKWMKEQKKWWKQEEERQKNDRLRNKHERDHRECAG